MCFERILLELILGTLLVALILGGVPWKFPGQGKYWLDHLNQEIMKSKTQIPLQKVSSEKSPSE
jgi:hypothetical protein